MTPENLYTPNCIRTAHGFYVNVFEPDVSTININDIAHALSMQCRFGGHLPVFYSVAQHCVTMSRLMHESHKMAALLHDASEAYLLDIPRPIKSRLSNYKEIEDQLMKLIAAKFGFSYPLHEKVKEVDEYMLQWEWHRLMLGKDIFQPIECWDQKKAFDEFLKEYYSINPTQP